MSVVLPGSVSVEGLETKHSEREKKRREHDNDEPVGCLLLQNM